MKTMSKKRIKFLGAVLAFVLAFGVFSGTLFAGRSAIVKAHSATENGPYGEATVNAFTSDYGSRAEVREAALSVNERIVAEGSVLLKNEGGLPLKSSKSNPAKVTILGKNQLSLIYQGSGSSGAASGPALKGIYDAFSASGMITNPYAEAFYRDFELSGTGRPALPSFGHQPSGMPVGETRAVGSVFYGSEKPTSGQDTVHADPWIGEAYDANGVIVNDKNASVTNIIAPAADRNYVGGQEASNYNVSIKPTANNHNSEDEALSEKNLRASFLDYNDAAIVFINRVGGEGYDLPRVQRMNKIAKDIVSTAYPNFRWPANKPANGTIVAGATQYQNTTAPYNKADVNSVMIPGAKSWDSHYLQIDQNEENLLKEACAYFDNVILVVNAGNAIEFGTVLEDPAYANVKSALWIGTVGENGIMALPKLLDGTINPSGNLVDTYEKDMLNNSEAINNPVSKYDYVENAVPYNPALYNFSNNNITNGNLYSGASFDSNVRFIDYQEGVYLGYKYYETGYAEVLKAEGKDAADEWYNKRVVRPFGFGLSYTTFSTEVTGRAIDGFPFQNGAPMPASFDYQSEFEISVKVTNTGKLAGKKTVQIYAEAPYTVDGIEKPSKVFVGYEKTGLLAPGKSEILKINVPAYYIASYDWSDANSNQFKGYELEKGAYKLHVADDAHNTMEAIDFTIGDGGILFEKDPFTDNPVSNLFEDSSQYMKNQSAILSRANNFANYSELSNGSKRRVLYNEDGSGHFATQAEADAFLNKFNANTANRTNEQNHGLVNGNYFATSGDFRTDQDTAASVVNAAASLKAIHAYTGAPVVTVAGKPYPVEQNDIYKDYDATTIKWADMYGVEFDAPEWDAFLNQLSWTQMQILIGGNTGTKGASAATAHGWAATGGGITSNRFFSVRLDNVGKPIVTHLDGPVGFSTYTNQNQQAAINQGASNSNNQRLVQSIYNTVGVSGTKSAENEPLRMASTTLVAATMDHELQYQVGLILGEDGLTLYDHIDNYSSSGLYGPAANIHRTAFSGRNFEYFSECANLSGLAMAGMVTGMQEKGVFAFMKHFFMNDQETHRDTNSLGTFATEQAIRETYGRGFEIAVKAAVKKNDKLMGIMGAFNRVGFQWANESHQVMTDLLKDEWGFRGDIITDWTGTDGSWMHTEGAVLAGTSKQLGQYPPAMYPILTYQEATVDAVTGEQWTAAGVANKAEYLDLVNSYKWAIRRAVKEILFSDVNSNAINHATGVQTLALNTTVANNNADNTAHAWKVGEALSYNLMTEPSNTAARNMVPTVIYGDKTAAEYSFALAEGSTLPSGLFLTPDGKIVGTPSEPTAGASRVRIDVFAKGKATDGSEFVYNKGIWYVTINVAPADAVVGNTDIVYGGSYLGAVEIDKEIKLAQNISVALPTIPALDEAVVTYNIKAGYSMPAGVKLGGSTGLITGKPTADAPYTAFMPIVASILVIKAEGISINGESKNEGDVVTFEATFTLQIGVAQDGKDGLQGEQGEKGEQGEQGLTGPQGNSGNPGAPGTPGAPGEPGAPGAQGEQGPQGLQGEAGADGGGCGSVMTPAGSTMLFALVLSVLGATFFVFRRREKNKN